MALTWGTLLGGAVVVFAGPIAILALNRWKRNVGWWLLFGTVALMVAGNLLERATDG